jgi:hypothetical protein
MTPSKTLSGTQSFWCQTRSFCHLENENTARRIDLARYGHTGFFHFPARPRKAAACIKEEAFEPLPTASIGRYFV